MYGIKKEYTMFARRITEYIITSDYSYVILHICDIKLYAYDA